MANVNQIYMLVNDSAKEALGESAITVKNTSTLVALGEKVLSSENNTEDFYKSLTNRIGKTVVAVREYAPRLRNVMKTEMDWGLIYQKISYKRKNAVENASWHADTQASPFDVEISTEAVQKLFKKMGTYSYEDSIPDYQLSVAFTNEKAMGAFISGIYVNMQNALNIAEENLANLAVNTYIAGALISGTPNQKRNLLAEYNTTFGGNLTAETCLTDKDFLKFASREISTTIKNLSTMSTLFNAEKMDRFTRGDKLIVEVLSKFGTACNSYLEADTYHNELVKLPNYEEVVYWQGSGLNFAFDDVSKISISNKELATSDNEDGSITQNGIIAFVHDADACASIISRRRSHSIYNPRAERFNIFEKADKGYMVDLSENGVVFYIADVEA